MITAKILADSFITGARLTTFELTLPRSILAEYNTHCMLARNAASSRAIPQYKLIDRIHRDPFIPKWRHNQKGMSPAGPLDEGQCTAVTAWWLDLMNRVINESLHMDYKYDIHKGYLNRLLEPWMYTTVISSATDWANMFGQRYHEAAEPSFYELAECMYEAYNSSEPREITTKARDAYTSWHLPLIDEETYESVWEYCDERKSLGLDYVETLKMVSAGRCARVSYLTHDGKRDIDDDIRIFNKMVNSSPGHWSPLEHVATPANVHEMKYEISQLVNLGGACSNAIRPKLGELGYCAKFKGFKQFRKFFEHENITEFSK